MPQFVEEEDLEPDAYWKFVDQLLAICSKLGQVWISLHPKMKVTDYEKTSKKYGAVILAERLNKALPIADLFIATNSSTVFWALLCGIKSVVTGFAHIDCSMFSEFSSIQVIKQKVELSPKITEWSDKEVSFENDWNLMGRGDVFDDQVLLRYRELIMEFSGKTPDSRHHID